VFRFLLAPRWLALHLVFVLAIAGFVVLGSWQLDVYHESNSRQDVRDRAPVPVEEVTAAGSPLGDGADHRVIATGTYLAEQQLLVPGRIHNGVLGSYVLTPLRTDQGMIVPVIRGWVDDPDDAGTRVPDGEVRVTGFLLPPETADYATVRRDRPLEDDQLGYIAPDTLAQRTGLPAADTVAGYVLLTGASPDSSPAPVVLDVDAVAPIRDVNPWQNLSYWAQWWVFALAAVVFWCSIVRSAVRSRRTSVSEPTPTHVPS
jgi:cytochrome oxidase assembly protein ShyY1